MTELRAVNGDIQEQKMIDSLISAFTVIMSKEPNLGTNLISLSLAIVEDQPFEDSLTKFDDKNPLHQKAKEVLVNLRNLNKKPINTAYTALIVSRIKVNLALQKNNAANQNNKTEKQIGF
ncbi:MAG: hypothetical protein RLN62_01655 [Rickettsiales bacterium]